MQPLLRIRRQQRPDAFQTAAVPQMYTKREMQRQLDPKFLPQQVAYDGKEKPGTIVIDSGQKFLYLVMANGQARRYGVGVGKEGFGWTGTHNITRKAVWPEWRPPAEMIVREREKGRILPVMMDGGPANPLGARAMYLGDTLYRIHGTNAPWTIGTNVSSGCIRLAQRGRRRPVRARQGRHQGDRHVIRGGRPELLRGRSGRPRERAARRNGSAALFVVGTGNFLKPLRLRPAIGPVEQFDGVDDRHPCAAGDLRDAADVAGGDDVGAGRRDVPHLAVAQLRRRSRAA